MTLFVNTIHVELKIIDRKLCLKKCKPQPFADFHVSPGKNS